MNNEYTFNDNFKALHNLWMPPKMVEKKLAL